MAQQVISCLLAARVLALRPAPRPPTRRLPAPRRAPSITVATPTTPTTATVTLNAPADGAVASYSVTACPVGTTAPSPGCRTATCETITCTFGGASSLTAGQSYGLTATATMASPAREVRPASNSVPLDMPAATAPMLVAAQATGPSSAGAQAKPPPNARFLAVR